MLDVFLLVRRVVNRIFRLGRKISLGNVFGIFFVGNFGFKWWMYFTPDGKVV